MNFRVWIRRLWKSLENFPSFKFLSNIWPPNLGPQPKLPHGMMAVDYSLYLVTDSTSAILGNKDLVSVVESAIVGGVTIVQYRDKTSETADLIRMGKRLHAITRKHNVPLLINDRIDVALAIGAEGVHLGQEDTGMTA